MNINDVVTQPRAKVEFDDAAVSALALISMYQSMAFLILQLIVNIPMVLVVLFLEKKNWDEGLKETIIFSIWILIESVLIYVLAKKGKGKFNQYMAEKSNKTEINDKNRPQYFETTLTETQIERTIGFTALAGISWGLFIGIEIKSLQILLIIIEGAAFLFMSIFVLTRFLTTKKFRPMALLFLALTGLSLWALLF